MPLHPQCFCVFRDGRRPFCVFCGKVRGGRTDATSASLPPCTPTAVRHDSLRLVSNLFGLLRPARRLFPPSMRRQRDGEADRSAGEGER